MRMPMLIPAAGGGRPGQQISSGLLHVFQLTARKVTESTKQEGGNAFRVWRKVIWVHLKRRGEFTVSDEFVGDNLGRKKPGDLEAVGRGCSEQEDEWPEDVRADELQSERVAVVRAQSPEGSYPRETRGEEDDDQLDSAVEGRPCARLTCR